MTPITFTSSCFLQSAGDTSSKRPIFRTPAQLKRTSIRAWLDVKSATAPDHDSSFATSSRPWLARSIVAAVWRAPSTSMSKQPTAQPLAPKRCAVARPIPAAAPVTKMDLGLCPNDPDRWPSASIFVVMGRT